MRRGSRGEKKKKKRKRRKSRESAQRRRSAPLATGQRRRAGGPVGSGGLGLSLRLTRTLYLTTTFYFLQLTAFFFIRAHLCAASLIFSSLWRGRAKRVWHREPSAGGEGAERKEGRQGRKPERRRQEE